MEEAPALSGKALRGSGMAFEIDTSTAFGLAVTTRFDNHSNTMPIRVTPEKHRG